MGTDQSDGVSHAIRLAAIKIGDVVTFQRNGKPETGVVDGWIDRLVNGRPTKCVELEGARLWVPITAIAGRRRLSGSGAGEVVFSKDAAERRL